MIQRMMGGCVRASPFSALSSFNMDAIDLSIVEKKIGKLDGGDEDNDENPNL